MIPKFRDVLAYYMNQSGGVLGESFDGSIYPVDLDDPAATTAEITDAMIAVDSNNLAKWNYHYSSAENIISRIEVWYKPITPLKDGYAARKYCQRNGYSAGEATDNFLVDGDIYSGYLASAYDIIGEDRTLTVYLSGVRDEATAEAWAKLWIRWRMQYLAIMELTCNYSVLAIEQFDKVTATATVLPAFLQSKTWMVIGQRITPSISKEPEVKLTLIEVGPSSVPTDEEWQKTADLGDEYQIQPDTGDTVTMVA